MSQRPHIVTRSIFRTPHRITLLLGLSLITIGLIACITDIDEVTVTGLFSDPAGTQMVPAGDAHGTVYIGANVAFRYNPNYCEENPPHPEERIALTYTLVDLKTGAQGPLNSVFDTTVYADGDYDIVAHAYAWGGCDLASPKDSAPFRIHIRNVPKYVYLVCWSSPISPSDANSSSVLNSQLDWTGQEVGKELADRYALPRQCSLQEQPKEDIVECALVGDPLHLYSGKLIENRTELSWSAPGGGMVFARTYISGGASRGQFGVGWSHSYERRIQDRGTGGVAEIDGRGQELVFSLDSSGNYASPRPGAVSLSREDDGSWVVAYKAGVTYRYQSDGKLVSLSDRNGNTYRLEYSLAGDLSRIVDPTGAALQIEIVDGLIRSATAKNGDRCLFAYSSDGRLLAATDPRGNLTSYRYDSTSGNLVGIGHPTGDSEEFTYRPEDQKIVQVRSVSSLGRETVSQVEYVSDTVRRYTDPLGAVTVYEYDSKGLLIKRTDPDGGVYTMIRDDTGRILSRADPAGNVESWTYGADGNVLSYQSPMNEVTTVERDPTTGYPTTLIQPDGTRIQRQFDAAGNLLSVKDALDREARYVRNARGQVIIIVDALGRTTQNQYDDANGQLVAVVDSLGQVTKYERDSLGRVAKETTPSGRTAHVEYCYCGQPSVITDAAGQMTRYDFDSLGRRIAATLPNGARTEYTYERINGHDVVIAMKDASGNSVSISYDNAGRMASQVDSLGRTIVYARDLMGRVTRVSYPGGNYTLMRYNAAGRVSESETARGAVTKFFYDADGRLIRTESPDGSAMAQAYDARGRVITRTRADGGVEQLVYDAAGQLVAAIDPMGSISRMEYTLAGAVSRVLDTRDKATQFRYDALDRLIETTDPLGYTTGQAYTQDSETESTKNANGATTGFRYDPLGRLVEVTDPLGNKLSRTYDPVGNVLSVADENQHRWTFSYNLLSRKLTETDPNNRTTNYQYNVAGELNLVVFADGSKWRYARDAAGRVTERRLEKPDGTIEDTETFGYDLVGNRILSENASVKTTSAFDLMDRETRRTVDYKASGSRRVLTFLYDAMGRRQMMVDSHGRATGYMYDTLSRPLTITVAEPQQGACGLETPFRTRTYTFTWDKASNLIQVDYPNGTRTRRMFDAANRLTAMVHERVEGARVMALQKYTYMRDPVGNITQTESERGETTRYQYDAKGQLIRALLPKSMITRLKGQKHTSGIRKDPYDREPPDEEAEERLLHAEDVTYTYDPAGNRIEEKIGRRVIPATYSPANEMLTRGRITYRYDHLGNQVEKEGPGNWHQVYGYSVAGRLVSFSKGHDHERLDIHRDRDKGCGHERWLKEVERYLYNPDNERVGIEDKASGMRTQFVWDGGRPVEEWQEVGRGANKTDVGILYARDLGGQLLDQVRYTQNRREMLADLDGCGADDREDEDEDPGPRAPKLRHVRFVYPDHLGSTSLITNAQGHRLDRLQYGPWGEALGGNHWRTRFTYTGHQREARTGNYYSVYRYLDPRAGRWTQRDPLGDVDAANLFVYAENDPVSRLDPLGLWVTMTFKRAQHLLIVRDEDPGGETIETVAHSGLGKFMDKPGAEWKYEEGPIPGGVYLIGNRYTSTVDVPGDKDWYRLYGRDGKGGISYDSIPVVGPGGKVYYRGLFDFHTGDISEGCLSVPSDVKSGPRYPTSKVYNDIKRLINHTSPYKYQGRTYRGVLIVQ